MGNGNSKKESFHNIQPDVVEVKEDNNCSNSVGSKMARGAFMAVNPAGALISRAIMSHKSHNKNSANCSTTDGKC